MLRKSLALESVNGPVPREKSPFDPLHCTVVLYVFPSLKIACARRSVGVSVFNSPGDSVRYSQYGLCSLLTTVVDCLQMFPGSGGTDDTLITVPSRAPLNKT